jgi:uncharacterized membrane protein
MSWRFRKSFKIIPGVKLNLTNRGLSATFGVAPFSVNVGPNGVYRNLSIPGTGIWDRQRIGGSPRESSDSELLPAAERLPAPLPPLRAATEIRSASTETLTSESLEGLRRVLTEAYNERNELTQEVALARREANSATERFDSWNGGFLFKRMFKKSFAARKERAETAAAKLGELQEQLRLTTIATEISVDKQQAEPYYQMRDSFAILSQSNRTWNVLTEKAIDRVAERSNANTAVTRTAVPFSLGSCDLIEWEQKVPHLPNRTGGDMYVYPGFILYRASKQAFALIDFRDVTLRFVRTEFTETDPIPSDSQVVGRTWAKCNKDGTPDRRFRENYQIPIALYGTLLFSSLDGLDVRYICSNARSAEDFVKAWAAFRFSLDGHQPPPLPPAMTRPAPGQEPRIDAFKKANAAFESLKGPQEEFLAPIRGAVTSKDSSEPRTMTKEVVSAYLVALKNLIEADTALEKVANIVARGQRTAFRRSLKTIEEHRAAFDNSLVNGRITDETLWPFVNATTAFMEQRTAFIEAATEAINTLGSTV